MVRIRNAVPLLCAILSPPGSSGLRPQYSMKLREAKDYRVLSHPTNDSPIVCVFITGEGESQNKGKQIWSFLSGDEHAATEDSSPSMGGGKYLLACRIRRVGVLSKSQRVRSTWGPDRAGSTRQRVGRAS